MDPNETSATVSMNVRSIPLFEAIAEKCGFGRKLDAYILCVSVGVAEGKRNKITKRENSTKYHIGGVDPTGAIRHLAGHSLVSEKGDTPARVLEEYADFGVHRLHDLVVGKGHTVSEALDLICGDEES
jgi:hypothetical protein